MTIVQKVLSRACNRDFVEVGSVVEPEVDLAMSHENAALVINQFQQIFEETGKSPKVWDPARIALIFDHRVPAESAKTANNQKKIRDFAVSQGITKFHDLRGDQGGICHQILPENGYVRPGMLVTGTDSHTTSHGALGSFAFGIGATEMASVWALGKVLNVEVPATIKIVAEGEFPPFTAPKEEDLPLVDSDPGQVRSRAYDLALNGTEIGGGGIRIHQKELQETVFRTLGISAEEAADKFDFLLQALEFGAPPHGGIAFGLDRLLMIITGRETIRDVIAFPKTQKATCLLTEAPSGVARNQLTELALRPDW